MQWSPNTVPKVGIYYNVNLVLPPGWIFTTLGKESHVGPTVSRKYHHPLSGVFDDSFTTQNGCNSGNYHHVFLLAKLLVRVEIIGLNSVLWLQ